MTFMYTGFICNRNIMRLASHNRKYEVHMLIITPAMVLQRDRTTSMSLCSILLHGGCKYERIICLKKYYLFKEFFVLIKF